MVLDEPAIPHGWEVTSGSLSAWLCGRLHADGLLLVKSISESGETRQLDALIEGKVIDFAFGQFILESDVPVWLFTKRDSARLKNMLRGDMGGTISLPIYRSEKTFSHGVTKTRRRIDE